MKKQRVDEDAKLSKFMHNYLKKSTDHEKAVIPDDHNHRSKLTQGSHHDDTTSEPLIQPPSGNSIFWRTYEEYRHKDECKNKRRD